MCVQWWRLEERVRCFVAEVLDTSFGVCAGRREVAAGLLVGAFVAVWEGDIVFEKKHVSRSVPLLLTAGEGGET